MDKLNKPSNPISKESQIPVGELQPPQNYQGNPSYGRFQALDLRWDSSEAVNGQKLQATVERRVRALKRPRAENMCQANISESVL